MGTDQRKPGYRSENVGYCGYGSERGYRLESYMTKKEANTGFQRLEQCRIELAK